ncbi:MAG TPA: carboxypeptidase-like regulatory domain-containing protein, partial [Blastocatellia bacterium]|nr:carboxypeptidase-like regulatory domain-containing protein [Blastocatellia bacterium]
MLRKASINFASMLLAVFLAVTALAQTDRGTITGTVQDANGAAVAGASVTVTNIGTNTGLTYTTNSEGRFSAPALAVGSYRVKIEKTGFKLVVIEPLAVSVGATVNVTPTMEVGAVSQTVEITAATAAALQTESAKISATVATKLIEELPLVVSGAVRNPFDLAALTPEA